LDSSQSQNDVSNMQEFFRRDYPHLMPLVETENGREISAGVQRIWAQLLQTRDIREGIFDALPDLIQEFCQELALGYTRSITDEATRIRDSDPVQHYLDNVEKLWREVYEPRLPLSYQLAGAWLDWTIGGHTLTLNAEMPQEALSEFRGIGKDLARVITDYSETARTVVEDSLREARALRRFGLITAGVRLWTALSSAIAGIVIGIIPGLLLGMVGWHSVSGVVAGLLWVFFFTIGRKLAGEGGVDLNHAIISVSGGLGLWISITLFGGLTS